ncbi:GNAT family N-acetyltransferase [Telmatospirillum sp. J64-1]|uniref:GNAT family N-acetyltransferase n=1 Tax=Telmatospirillum sp. J64-1 TaxID=2502183 RepID=UPI00115F6C88|nr:GNAT family N-acetyltransferase [Telmatospirillum sp. J64-1]
MNLRIERLSGQGLAARLGDLARLRIAVFRDWPYLYDGDQAYEERYLRSYAETPDSVIVAALDGEKVVGAATALPMAGEPEEMRAAFAKAGFDPNRIFYFGESVLLSQYRGQGIGVEFFRQREAHARETGGYTHATFCAVDRPADHPRRPADYVPLDDFWRRRGFTPLPDMTVHFSWKDLDEAEESPKLMRFWIKELS